MRDAIAGAIRWGGGPQGRAAAVAIVVLGAVAPAAADPLGFIPTRTMPDAPAPPAQPAAAKPLPPTWDLDGTYVWLGPAGAASYIASQWDSTIGADLTVLRVREADGLGAIGGSAGAARWTERGGGRIWLDAVAGTRIFGWMTGVTAGPILELSEVAHPRIGGSIGVWTFFGIAPYARLGAVEQLGVFGELGLHIALPVVRHRSS